MRFRTKKQAQKEARQLDKGSTPSEKFIVDVGEDGTIVGFKFEPKPSMHTH